MKCIEYKKTHSVCHRPAAIGEEAVEEEVAEEEGKDDACGFPSAAEEEKKKKMYSMRVSLSSRQPSCNLFFPAIPSANQRAAGVSSPNQYWEKGQSFVEAGY